jgi:predicted MPP superfamily phosphohydrolase
MTLHDFQPTTPRAPHLLLRALTLMIATLLLAAAASPAPAAQESRRIVAVSDIHGALENFTAILREVGLVDEHLDWIGGDTIFVQTGDIVDRGPEVRATLDLLMRLQEDAPSQGGQVLVTLGNHEVMNLAGFLRDTTPADTAAFVDEHSQKRQADAYEQWQEMRTARAETMGQPAPRFTYDAQKAWEQEHPPGYAERMDAFGPEGVYGR